MSRESRVRMSAGSENVNILCIYFHYTSEQRTLRYILSWLRVEKVESFFSAFYFTSTKILFRAHSLLWALAVLTLIGQQIHACGELLNIDILNSLSYHPVLLKSGKSTRDDRDVLMMMELD